MDVRIALWLRLLMWFAVVVASINVVLLSLFPDRTVEYFAWEIKNPLTAVLMGAGYLNIVLLLALVPVLTNYRWSRNWMIIGTGVIFTGVLGVATFLHVNTFFWDRAATWIWTLLYTVVPFLFAFGFWWHARQGVAELLEGPPLHPMARTILIVVAAVFGLFGLALFAFPDVVGTIWPWSLTPLTGRVAAGWLLSFAAIYSLSARSRYWHSVRWAIICSTACPLLLFLNGFRFLGSFKGGISLVVYFAVMVVWLLGVAYLVMYHEQRASQAVMGSASSMRGAEDG